MARNFGGRGEGRGRAGREKFDKYEEENKYEKIAAAAESSGPTTAVAEDAKKAEIAAEVAQVEAKAEQPSIEEKRLIEAGVKPDDKSKQVTSQAALAQTEELIRTPSELADRLALPTSKLPAMESDVPPEDTTLPPTQSLADAASAQDTSKPLTNSGYMSMNCGGSVLPVGLMGPDNIVGFDPVSGNPIPLGSTAENVRDDIPAALSKGEYVVPSDVVSWFGLRTYMAMHEEAKMGLMSMYEMGQLRTHIGEEVNERETCDCGESDCPVCAESDEEDTGMDDSGDRETTGIDSAEVITEYEEYPMQEDSVGVEPYPTTGGRFTVGDEQVLLIFKSPKKR
jgi:hypothetical protein